MIDLNITLLETPEIGFLASWPICSTLRSSVTLLPVSMTAVAPQAASIVMISELDLPERILPDIVCNKAYPTQVSKEILQK